MEDLTLAWATWYNQDGRTTQFATKLQEKRNRSSTKKVGGAVPLPKHSSDTKPGPFWTGPFGVMCEAPGQTLGHACDLMAICVTTD